MASDCGKEGAKLPDLHDLSEELVLKGEQSILLKRPSKTKQKKQNTAICIKCLENGKPNYIEVDDSGGAEAGGMISVKSGDEGGIFDDGNAG